MKGHLFMEMTDAEYLEFSYLYEVYKTALWKEMDLFYSAFIQKNGLFPPDSLKDGDIQTCKEKMSHSELVRMSMMMNGIERTQVRKAIEEPKNDNI